MGIAEVQPRAYHRAVPFLIDGNNLMYALRNAGLNVGRGGLCRLLERFAPRRQRVVVVFDGPPPRNQPTEPPGGGRIEVHYSGPENADQVIAEHIAADTAPRRLTVVSTDREIRKAARRRRCQTQSSEDFAAALTRAMTRPRKRRLAEPPEKRHGLTAEQTEAWLRELQLDVGPAEKEQELP
jgi:hypothetical protein